MIAADRACETRLLLRRIRSHAQPAGVRNGAGQGRHETVCRQHERASAGPPCGFALHDLSADGGKCQQLTSRKKPRTMPGLLQFSGGSFDQQRAASTVNS
jgi:hypothetical protein